MEMRELQYLLEILKRNWSVYSTGNVGENAHADRSSSAGPDREAARCVVEAMEDADEEGSAR